MSLRRHRSLAAITFLLATLAASNALAQSRGLRAISVEDMRHWLRFLGAKEFRGRSAPSADLDLASRYIALEAARIGLQPLLPGGSYFQEVPVDVTTISSSRSRLRVSGPSGELRLQFPQAFTSNIRAAGDWSASGSVVFAGTSLAGPEPKWNDDQGDLKGAWVVVLDPPAPAGPVSQRAQVEAARAALLRAKGALGVITVIAPEREANLASKGLSFDVAERLRFLDVDTLNPLPVPQPGQAAPPQPGDAGGSLRAMDVRHEAAAAILGIPADEMRRLVEAAWNNQVVAPRALPGRSVEAAVFFETRKATTANVVAYLPGSDPKLKDEYIVIGAHHDHNPPREGRVFPGADDNASGCVGMLTLAKALTVERPKRSVVFVWHTAEERGLVGAYYFVQHPAIPVEKISANLNLDMIGRNDPNGIYLIGSNKLSSQLDASLVQMNDRHVRLTLDHRYDDPGDPNRFFFRSDHYPYVRCGIPSVWLFSGTTADYHREGDVEEKVDYGKMEKVIRLTYLVAMDIGNKPELLELDVHPQVKSRGAHNMKVVWRRQ